AGHDQALAVALVLGHLEDGVDRLLLGVVDEGAGVDDDDVGVARVGRDLVARLLGVAEHHLAVDEVLGTTEGDETYLHWELTTGTSCTASADTEWPLANFLARNPKKQTARSPCRSRRAARCRSGGDRDTTRTL